MTFKGVGIDHAGRFVDADTTTAFSTEAAASILDRHQLLGEGTLLKVKVERIQADQLGKQHVVGLLLASQVVSENETAFLTRVTVQVDVEFQVAQLVLGNNGLLDLVNCRLLIRTWAQVEPVEIMIVRVQPVVPSCDSVRIDQRYDLDHVILKYYARLVTLRQDEVNDSIQDV